MPYSGSTSSWIADADGKDIARVSGDCPEGLGCSGKAVVAYPDKVVEQIVQAVNTNLTEGELHAVAIIVTQFAHLVGEDVMGAILKTGGFRCLGDSDAAVVDLARKLEAALRKPPATKEPKA